MSLIRTAWCDEHKAWHTSAGTKTTSVELPCAVQRRLWAGEPAPAPVIFGTSHTATTSCPCGGIR